MLWCGLPTAAAGPLLAFQGRATRAYRVCPLPYAGLAGALFSKLYDRLVAYLVYLKVQSWAHYCLLYILTIW